MRRVFRKGFAQKVARTSVLKHYGLKTLLYGVLLPGPGHRRARRRRRCAAVRDAGFEVGLHTFDHVRWQDNVARGRARLDAGANSSAASHAFERVFGCAPGLARRGRLADQRPCARSSSASMGCGTRATRAAARAFLPLLGGGASGCPQLPTTLPTFDELIGSGRRRRVEHRRRRVRPVARRAAEPASRRCSRCMPNWKACGCATPSNRCSAKWRAAGAALLRMAAHACARRPAGPAGAGRGHGARYRGDPACWRYRRRRRPPSA